MSTHEFIMRNVVLYFDTWFILHTMVACAHIWHPNLNHHENVTNKPPCNSLFKNFLKLLKVTLSILKQTF